MNEKIPIIKPYQKLKIAWDILICLVIVFFLFIIPLQISFNFEFEEESLHYLETKKIHHSTAHFIVFIPEILLIIDTFLKLITGYYENGIVITSKRKILHHYIKKSFVFDLLAYSPLIIHNITSIYGSQQIILNILQLLMFFKIPRVQIVLKNFEEMISLEGKNDYFLNIFILAFKLIFFTHLIACIWHSWAYYDDSPDNITWLDVSNVRGLNWMARYSYSLYWAVTVLVAIGGLEKIGPQNPSELFLGVLIMVASACVYAYSLNLMRVFFDQMNKKDHTHRFFL